MSDVFYDDGSVPAARDSTDDEHDDQLEDDLTITQEQETP